MRERKRTIQVIHDLLEALVLPNLINDFLDGIYHGTVSGRNPLETVTRKHRSLKMTPINVKMISCEMTKNAKYLASTARSRRECVVAP